MGYSSQFVRLIAEYLVFDAVKTVLHHIVVHDENITPHFCLLSPAKSCKGRCFVIKAVYTTSSFRYKALAALNVRLGQVPGAKAKTVRHTIITT